MIILSFLAEIDMIPDVCDLPWVTNPLQELDVIEVALPDAWRTVPATRQLRSSAEPPV